MAANVTMSGRLFVKIVKATNVPSSDLLSEPDCYVAIKTGKTTLGRTKTAQDSLNPLWNQDLHFDAEFEIAGDVSLEIYDKDRITRDDLLGKVKIPVKSIHHRRDEGDEIVTARLEGKKTNENSTLTYSISFRKFSWEEEVQRLEQSNVELQQNIDQLHETNSRLEQITNNLHHEVQDLKQITTDLHANVEQLHHENDNLEKLCTSFHLENDKLNHSNERLKENVEKFQEQNSHLKGISDNLRDENVHFKQEVDRLSRTIAGLETVKQTIETYAEENKSDLRHIIDKLNATLAEQKEVYNVQMNVLQETKTATKQQEKILLLQLQSQCQSLDGAQGMDKKEFQQWVSMIPKKYLDSPAGLEFSKFDQDRDGVISISEFNALVDQLVQSETN